jgi:hypothetical protein
LNSSLQEEHRELCPSEFLLCCILQLLDTSQQWLDFLGLSILWQGVPGSKFHQAFVGIKWSKPIFVDFGRFLVLDVEPLLSPTLNRFSHLESKVLRFRPHRNNGAAEFRNFLFGPTRAQIEELLP